MSVEITPELLQDLETKAKALIEIYMYASHSWWADPFDWTVKHVEDDFEICRCDCTELADHVAAADPDTVLAMVAEIRRLQAELTQQNRNNVGLFDLSIAMKKELAELKSLKEGAE